MTHITFKGRPIHTSGELPKVGSIAPDFSLARQDLSDAHLSDFSGAKILNIFPSLDTSVCAMSVRAFEKAGVQVLHISKDLPFAHKRFCAAETPNATTLSAFRSSFAKDYGLEITDSLLAGLCSRAVIVLDADNRVIYTEQVSEITHEPNYEHALEKLRGIAS